MSEGQAGGSEPGRHGSNSAGSFQEAMEVRDVRVKERRRFVGDRTTRRIRWIARIWGALIVAVALMILIGYAWNWATTGTADPYAVEDYPPIENLPPLFALASALGLALAWRWEGIGGAIAVAFSLAALPVLLIHWPIAQDFPRYLAAPYGVWMLVAIPGVLFLVCWQRSRKPRGG